jgi:hypothetical protein
VLAPRSSCPQAAQEPDRAFPRLRAVTRPETLLLPAVKAGGAAAQRLKAWGSIGC